MDTVLQVEAIIAQWHVHPPSPKDVQATAKLLAKQDRSEWSKSKFLEAYKQWLKKEDKKVNSDLVRALRRKPIRTMSGVAPVTVLTKPFPCPGQCIFCPNDIRMPKSYLADEPGAQRAERNWFDPYLQTYSRLIALQSIGHEVEKVELIVLGGTWSFYSEEYQRWFISECFKALNDFSKGIDQMDEREHRYLKATSALRTAGRKQVSNDPVVNQEAMATLEISGSAMQAGEYNRVIEQVYSAPERAVGFANWQKASWEDIEKVHAQNEYAAVKCVGLVLETRPDSISLKEVLRLRRLGATKVQIGVQSLQDSVLRLNKRGHDVAATARAFALLRQAGFKIHAHWMANLYGSNPQADCEDFDRLFTAPYCPDELKIYPCSLIESAELMQQFRQGKWQPYSDAELLKVVSHALVATPKYCRLTRIIRDIPSQYIVEGNKKTNFRQIAEKHAEADTKLFKDIRSREIRLHEFDPSKLQLLSTEYDTATTHEVFIEWNVATDQIRAGMILGFLRLSLPLFQSEIAEITHSALIREVHVYGSLTPLGSSGHAQHLGLGKKLIDEAKDVARKAGFASLAVISAIGTKAYYRKLGFTDGQLYQHLDLDT